MSNCRSGATYFIGLLAHCVMVSIVEVALFIGIGRLYGVPMPTHWAAILMTLVLGAASFCALGVAVASLIRNAEAAPAVVQFVLFPLVFISGTYFPIHSGVLNRIAGVLPVRPFNEALLGPFAQHTGFDWPHLAVLLAWGVIGAAVAIRRFRWDPGRSREQPVRGVLFGRSCAGCGQVVRSRCLGWVWRRAGRWILLS
jgi:ABC-2 type transport system permease protein